MAKILVISDIHANLVALEAVLQDAGQVDQVFCLGDIAGYGPLPNECIARLRSLSNLTCMMGNHDFAALGDLPLETFNHEARKALHWQKKVLTAESKQFLGELSQTMVVNGDVSLVHGSPRDSIWEYIMNTLSARMNLNAFETSWCFMGHSHFQAIFQYTLEKDEITIEVPRQGETYAMRERAFLNPGSVGQPRDRDPRAAYAIYDPQAQSWEPHRVAYDIHTVQQQILDAGLPARHAERLAGGW